MFDVSETYFPDLVDSGGVSLMTPSNGQGVGECLFSFISLYILRYNWFTPASLAVELVILDLLALFNGLQNLRGSLDDLAVVSSPLRKGIGIRTGNKPL